MRARARVVTARVGAVLVVGLPLAAVGGAHAASSSSWVWPVESRSVTRSFAPPAERYGTGHRGVDLAVATGSPVRAAGAGRVSYAGLLAGRGVVVVVHGDLRTTYEPVEALVGVGEPVRAGEIIARVSGLHLGCSAPGGGCLHWGLLRGETYLNPLSLVRRGPSRLLPVPPPAERPGLASAPVPARVRATPLSLPSLAPAPTAEPGWTLRSARTGSAGGALLALLLGLALLVRRPPQPGPEAPAAAQLVPCPVSPDEVLGTAPGLRHEATIVDLTAHRVRRRA